MVHLLLQGLALGYVEHEPLPVADLARFILYHDRLVTYPLCPPVAVEYPVLRREDLARLSGPPILRLYPPAVLGMHHSPPEIRILAFLRRVTRQGLYLRAHVHGGIGVPDLLDVDDRGDPLDERAVPLLGLRSFVSASLRSVISRITPVNNRCPFSWVSPRDISMGNSLPSFRSPTSSIVPPTTRASPVLR